MTPSTKITNTKADRLLYTLMALFWLATCGASGGTEAQDSALFKGCNPLGEAMGKPVFANRVFQHGYHCWDPSLIKRGDTYHLFYSRWKMVEGQVNNLGHWMTTSEIVHAISKDLLGPYTQVENPLLTASDHHGWNVCNCKVTPEYHVDGSIRRYLLYFLNVRKGAIAGTSWLYSDDLSPGSWYGQHDTFTPEAKFNNPAILFNPDGSAYGLSKSNDPAYPGTQRHLLAYRTKDFRAHPEDAKKRWGNPLPNNRGTINQLPGDVDHEDACIWEVNGQYHALMTDMSGRATGGKKKAVMHWFTDAKSGTNYRLYSDVPLGYVHDAIEFSDGLARKYYRMERPQVYVNPETGEVEAFLLACTPYEASQSVPTEGSSIIIWPVNNWKPATEPKPASPETWKQDIDWAKMLTANDLVWTNGIEDTWGESAFIANGLTGASIYRLPGEDWTLRWELGRTDVAAEYHTPGIDWSIPRVPIGNILLQPAGKVKNADMRLDIWNAEARGGIETDKGAIQWRSFIERDTNVVVVESQASGGESGLKLDLAEQWAISGRIAHTKTDPATLDPKHLPPKPCREEVDGLTVVIQPLVRHGAHATAYVNEPFGRGGNRFLLSVGKAHVPELSREQNIALAVKQAVEAVKRARREGVGALRARHQQWWQNYLTQAYVALPDDPQWEQFYWLQIYKFGGASRADIPILTDNMGPWFTQCGWPGTWWNLNIQLSYYPTFSANRLDVGRTMINALDHFHAQGVFAAKDDPEAYCMGRLSTYNLQNSGGSTYELGNLTWALHNYWRYWRYSMDENIARNLFPILKRNINYYYKVMNSDADGTIHLPPMVSPEYNYPRPKNGKPGPLPDTNYSHQLFRWGLQTLLDLNTELGLNDPDVDKWKATLEKLIPLPVGEHGLKISAGEDYNYSHRHYSHLLALYPLHTIHPDQGAKAEALFRKSLERWHSLPRALASYSYTGGAAMYATLGEGDTAIATLDKMLGVVLGKGIQGGEPLGQRAHRKAGVMWNTMYAEGGGPVIETPLSVVESIGYMLIQSWGGCVRVFPAMPARWKDAVFHDLRTEGGFLVSAEWKDGKTQWIRITSLAGAPLLLQTDLTDFKPVGDTQVSIRPLDGPRGQQRWQINLKKGKTVHLR